MIMEEIWEYIENANTWKREGNIYAYVYNDLDRNSSLKRLWNRITSSIYSEMYSIEKDFFMKRRFPSNSSNLI